jgi:hypothetical protein
MIFNFRFPARHDAEAKAIWNRHLPSGWSKLIAVCLMALLAALLIVLMRRYGLA